MIQVDSLEGFPTAQRKLARKIQTWVKVWSKIMGLDRFTLYIHWMSEPDGSKRASVNPMWEYQMISIRFYLPTMVEDTEEECQDAVVHELTHTLVEPLVGKKTDEKLLEMVVVNITKAFLATRSKII